MSLPKGVPDVPYTPTCPEYAKLRRAVRAYFRAKDDTSWGPQKDWHKRHDQGKAEAKLREMAGV